jgi:hypothetical protein
MGSCDDMPRRRHHAVDVAWTIDQRRVLTVMAAILVFTLAFLAMTMFGPGRPAADATEIDIFIQGPAVSAPVSASTVIWLRDAPPTSSAPSSRVGARTDAAWWGEIPERAAPR